MLENPVFYVDESDDTDDIPSNVTVIYRSETVTIDDDGEAVIEDSESDYLPEDEPTQPDLPDQDNPVLLPPRILFDTIVSTPHELYDGSIVSDIAFSVEDATGATTYEVRYTS